MRLPQVEQQLAGADRSAVDTASVAHSALDLLRPTSDVRGSAEWKATVVAHVLEDALAEAWEGSAQHV
jgi:CO/xanthine dehydrogenase FAD-binding subunit